jgi:hypothetical protein
MFTNKVKAATLLAVVMTMMPSCVMATNVKEPDWKVNLTTEVQKGVLNFKGSRCNNPVKVYISYIDNTDGSDKKPKPYEELWYNQKGKPIGQEKFNKYSIRSSEQIQMQIHHKNKQAEKEELPASANAAVRFFLDATVHKGTINALIVPSDSFAGIIEALEDQGFAKFQPTIDESTPSGDKPFLLIRTDDPSGPGQMEYMEYTR